MTDTEPHFAAFPQDARISSAHLHSCAHPFETHVRKYTRVHPLFPNNHTLHPLHILHQSLSGERKKKKTKEKKRWIVDPPSQFTLHYEGEETLAV